MTIAGLLSVSMGIMASLKSCTCLLLTHYRLSHQGPSDFQGSPFLVESRFNLKVGPATRKHFPCSLNNSLTEAISLAQCSLNPRWQTYFLVVPSWVLCSLCDRAL